MNRLVLGFLLLTTTGLYPVNSPLDNTSAVLSVAQTAIANSEILNFSDPLKPVNHWNANSYVVEVKLPSQIENVGEALLPLRREINRPYRALPWPAEMRKIVVVTEISGGRGDIAAGAKVITLMQKFNHELTFDWVFTNDRVSEYDPLSYLNRDERSNVHVRRFYSQPPEEAAGDFLVIGPVRNLYGISYLEKALVRKIKGPIFKFVEIAEPMSVFYYQRLEDWTEESFPQNGNKIYQSLYSSAFASKEELIMGLQPGSGVFLDPSRIEVPFGDSSPSYLLQIQDAELRADILEGQSIPNYGKHSFNFGYAHHSVSWGKFIDCVAIHEKNKHVVIVLNQQGVFEPLSTQEFQDRIFTSDRLSFLKEKGYETVLFKGQGQKMTLLQKVKNSQSGRHLTVIVRSVFAPIDMRLLQLAAERLLATGDNSAAESWSARCKLYVYEDVANSPTGAKQRFLQQQVDLAESISPTLSKLLAIFGGDKRLPSPFLNTPLSKEKMIEMEQLLNDPNLSNATFQFCEHIIANYSFDEILEAAVKRVAWHHFIQDLPAIEAATFDEGFFSKLKAYLKKPKTSERTLRVLSIPELNWQVQKAVQTYLAAQSSS